MKQLLLVIFMFLFEYALDFNKFNRIPTHLDAIATSPEWMAQVTFKVMDIDWAALSVKQSEWMQKWDTEIKNTEKDPKSK